MYNFLETTGFEVTLDQLWRYRMNIKGLYVTVFLTLIFSIYIIGCSKSNQELADAEAALQAAREAGAAELAPAEYEAAQELINRAKEMMAAGRHKEARDLLVDARYKAIEAKGKAESLAARGGLSDVEMGEMEEELSALKGMGGGSMGLMDIFFDYDRSDIRPDARPSLNTNARIINDRFGVLRVVVIEGYCDIRGTEEYNLALGQRRAESTKSFLVGLGVSPTKLEAVSKGETENWAPGFTEYDYQQNRRAHFVPVLMSPQALR
jgi:outer membrane protein OmpA-like peptidoglycan-associated protein